MRPLSSIALLALLPFAVNAQTEVEPNDDITQANPWAENTAISGSSCLVIGQADDIDWFVLVPSEEGRLTVSAVASNNTEGVYGITLQFYQKDGTTLFWNTGAPSGPEPMSTEISTLCAPNDTLYLKAYAPLDHCESYTLTYSITPPAFADDAEDNDDIAHATPVAVDTWAEGRVLFGYDDGTDYYRMDMTEDGRYSLTVLASYQTDGELVNGLTTQLVDVNEGLIANWSAQVGANTVLTTENAVSCVGPGSVYLKVAFGSFFGCGIAYRLKWEFEPTVYHYDVEPNNTYAEALFVPANTPVEGAAWEPDWYKLYKPYDGDLQLTVRSAMMEDVAGSFVVQVYNTAHSLIWNGGVVPGQGNVPTTDLITVAASVPDSFYVQVYNNAFDCGSYQLSYADEYVGIAEEDIPSRIAVQPNPSTEGFTFRSNGLSASMITVTDMEGRVVEDRLLNNLLQFDWDAASVSAGSYVARITLADGSSTTLRLIRTP